MNTQSPNHLLTEEELLEQFGNTDERRKFLSYFKGEEREALLEIIAAGHQAGLDWYFVKDGQSEMRLSCGRKNVHGSKAGGNFMNIKTNKKKGNHINPTAAKTRDIVSYSGIAKGTPIIKARDKAIKALINIANDKSTLPPIFMKQKREGHFPNNYTQDEPDIRIEIAKSGQKNEETPSVEILPMKALQNIIFYGPPGTGKTNRLQETMKKFGEIHGKDSYRFVTFHQSYSYEDFIEGLRPVLVSKSVKTDSDMGAGSSKKDGKPANTIAYEIKDGIFKELCRNAHNNPDKAYAIFIDEINRGNISKIFGELISLIEISKRTGREHEMTVTLPYSREEFSVPQNINIYGAMNTADRSLALLDIALRRRFDFMETPPKPETLKKHKVHDENGDDTGIQLDQLLQTINDRIEHIYDKEHRIGHAFFMPNNAEETITIEKLSQVFLRKIIPLLGMV